MRCNEYLNQTSTYVDMVLRYAHLAADHLLYAAKRIEGTNLGRAEKPQGLRLVVNR